MREDINQVMSHLWIKFLQKFTIKFCQTSLRKKGTGYLQDSKYFLDFRIITGKTKSL
jgi:hypothetical protein